MMDPKEALSCIRRWQGTEIAEALKEAENQLENAIPIKPIAKAGNKLYCGNCKQPIQPFYYCCPWCGKRIMED